MERKVKTFFGSRKLQLVLFLLVFLLGFGLRLWKYPFYPLTANAEEYLFVWSGLSLIEKGVPISWNDLPSYGQEHVYWEGVARNLSGRGELGVRLLKPWLDEPPLFSLMVGGISKLYGLENFTIISPYVIRIPSLIFAFFGLILVFLIAKKLFGYWIGLLSLLVYGTIPIVVFGSRLAVAENLVTLFYLLVLFLLMSYFETGKKWQRNLAIFSAGMAGLAKPTGFLIVPFLGYLIWQNKNWREGLKSLLAAIPVFVVPFLAYGFYFNKDLFLKVMAYQSQRPAGWSSLAYFITNPGFSVEVFLDSFIVIGFFSLIYLIFKKRGHGEELILFSFVFTLLTVVISGGRHDQLCWYRYPVYPFMSIAIALLIKDLVFNPSFAKSAIFIPLFLANADLLENPFWRVNFFINVRFYRLAFFVLLLPSILGLLNKSKVLVNLSRWAIVLAFAFGIFFNAWVIKGRFSLLCDHSQDCALPHKVNLLQPFLQAGD